AAALLVVLWILVLEMAVRSFVLHQPAFELVIPHVAFVTAFALLNLVSLRAEVARIRATSKARVDDQLRRLQEDARSYRLLGAGETSAEAEEGTERLERSSVEEIHQSVHYALDLLKQTLNLHTAVLLWLNDAGTHLRISELSTESEDVQDAPFPT